MAMENVPNFSHHVMVRKCLLVMIHLEVLTFTINPEINYNNQNALLLCHADLVSGGLFKNYLRGI
jgi:hypothetical protein